ncbi:hypothetical protein BAE44_0007165, partial [Dichanthelium oligosanthes]
MLSQLTGSYAFVLFDKSTNSLLVASDPEGKVPLFWGITADGCVAFSDDIDMLKGSCGKYAANTESINFLISFLQKRERRISENVPTTAEYTLKIKLSVQRSKSLLN